MSPIEIDVGKEIPDEFRLLQNFPNPFNPNTTIRFEVPGVGKVKVKIRIFDILGREVGVIVDDEFDPGYYEVIWDSRDRYGVEVSSGVYFYVMEAVSGGKTLFRGVRKMVVVK